MISLNLFEIVLQMINFIILLWLLNKVLIKPIIVFLEKREVLIEQNIKEATENKEKTNKVLKEQKAEFQKARKEARDILQKAEEDAKREQVTIMDKARADSEQIVANSKKEIELEFAQSKNELKTYVADLTVLLTEKILKKKLDSNDQKILIDDYLDSIKN
jgi:F-type H+-transporting ATPase subunit b